MERRGAGRPTLIGASARISAASDETMVGLQAETTSKEASKTQRSKSLQPRCLSIAARPGTPSPILMSISGKGSSPEANRSALRKGAQRVASEEGGSRADEWE